MSFRHMLQQAIAVAAVAGSVLHPGAAGAQCPETDRQWQRIEINLGSVAAPIVGNAGQLADDVAFAAYGATGTGVRFRADGGVGMVVDLEHEVARVGFEPVDVDGPAALAPTEPVWGITVYKTGTGPGALPAWGTVEAHGLWGGAAIEHRVTGRTWRMHLTGDAADLGRLAWRPTGVAEITAEEDSGDLLLTVEGAERQLTLHPAIATIGEDTQYLPFIADAEGTIRLAGEVPEGAVLDTVLVMAPYYHDADAVADGRGGFVAAGIAVDAVEAGGGSGRDVAVVRLGDDGRSFAGMTILASSGDDRAAGIASRAGDAYLAGTAGAADFPLAAKGGGETWPAPFAVRLSTAGELAAGGYLRPHGLDAARDVAVDAEGRVLISGVATPGAKDAGDLELTAVLPVEEGAPPARYALARFDGELTAASGLRTFDGAATELPLKVRIDCDGRHSVGLEQLKSSVLSCDALFPTWATRSYPNPPYPQPGVMPAGTAWFNMDTFASYQQPTFPHASWGFHALRWQQQHQLWPPIYNHLAAAQSTAPAVPVGHVGYLDAARLNALEANPAIFPAGDPPGAWKPAFATTAPSRRGLEAAIGAAAYAAFWQSPTYLNLRLGPSQTDGAAVMEVTFCSLRNPLGPNGIGPIEICDFILGGHLPIDEFDRECVEDVLPAAGKQIFLDSVRLHQWYDPDPGILATEVVMPGHEFMDRFEQAIPGDVYIGDPPAGARFAAGSLAETVDRQLAFMVEDVPVEITTFAGGQATVEPGLGLVRSIELQ